MEEATYFPEAFPYLSYRFWDLFEDRDEGYHRKLAETLRISFPYDPQVNYRDLFPLSYLDTLLTTNLGKGHLRVAQHLWNAAIYQWEIDEMFLDIQRYYSAISSCRNKDVIRWFFDEATLGYDREKYEALFILSSVSGEPPFLLELIKTMRSFGYKPRESATEEIIWNLVNQDNYLVLESFYESWGIQKGPSNFLRFSSIPTIRTLEQLLGKTPQEIWDLSSSWVRASMSRFLSRSPEETVLPLLELILDDISFNNGEFETILIDPGNLSPKTFKLLLSDARFPHKLVFLRLLTEEGQNQEKYIDWVLEEKKGLLDNLGTLISFNDLGKVTTENKRILKYLIDHFWAPGTLSRMEKFLEIHEIYRSPRLLQEIFSRGKKYVKKPSIQKRLIENYKMAKIERKSILRTFCDNYEDRKFIRMLDETEKILRGVIKGDIDDF